jgi:hypothetical protein
MHADNDNKSQTWGQRNAAAILTSLLFGLMALVILVQVAC